MFRFDMALEGLWYGPSVACLMNYLFYEYEIKKQDWNVIAQNIRDKMESDKANLTQNVP